MRKDRQHPYASSASALKQDHINGLATSKTLTIPLTIFRGIVSSKKIVSTSDPATNPIRPPPAEQKPVQDDAADLRRHYDATCRQAGDLYHPGAKSPEWQVACDQAADLWKCWQQATIKRH
jgi:hypothetical protein